MDVHDIDDAQAAVVGCNCCCSCLLWGAVVIVIAAAIKILFF